MAFLRPVSGADGTTWFQCGKCGKAANPDWHFCAYCGVHLELPPLQEHVEGGRP